MSGNNLMDNCSGECEFNFPRFQQLPRVPLYKDQVIIYIENILKPITFNSKEKILTPTMVNNYVKQKVVAAPVDKKYNESQVAYLIVICILKQVFSITEVSELLEIQTSSYPIEAAYDYFCTELEKALNSVFCTRNFSEPSSATRTTFETEIVRSAVMAFANKVYIQNKLNL